MSASSWWETAATWTSGAPGVEGATVGMVGGAVGLAATAVLTAGFAAGAVGVESNATVLVVGTEGDSCWLASGSSLAAGVAEVYLLEEGAVTATLPGEGLELFEERVETGSEGIGVVCCWVDLRPKE
jgi:hypothetical protein